MLETRNLKMKYGKKIILDDISLSFGKKMTTVILGKNGSGKTTLLRCLAGAIRKYEGEIILNGQNIRFYDDKQRARLLSLMPQLLPRPAISVKRLLEMGRYPYSDDLGRIGSKDQEIAAKALRECELEDINDKLVCHLSGGQRQLAYFGMAISQDSEIIMMDEPSSALDANRKKAFCQYLHQLKEKGKTIILSMHDINEALKIAEMIVVMDEGRIIFQGKAEELMATAIIKELFGLERKSYFEDGKECYFYL